MVSSQSANLPDAPHVTRDALAKNWWLILLRGICSILFGVLAFAWPGVTLVTLVLLYGCFALVDGGLAIAGAVTGGGEAPRWWLAIVGAVGIAAGLVAFAWPGMTAIVLVLVLAAWAIGIGIMHIIGAIKLREEIQHEWLLLASGIISVIFGLMLAIKPGAGALALVFVIASYAILEGVLLVLLSLRLHHHA